MENATRLAVVGAGLVGRRHCAAIRAAEGVELTAVVDPAKDAENLARQMGASWFASIENLVRTGLADGVILSTPNTLHAAGAEACIDAGLPVLVEKPIFTDLIEGKRILARAMDKGVAVATGHHRRHNPMIACAKAAVDEGRLGQIVTVHASVWLMKPDDYFDVQWRRQRGAGPVYLNLVHDIDLLQHLCGPIVEVRAMESNAIRGNEVEETSVILLRFESGTLGTVNVSDTVLSPWSWELTARENPAYPATNEDCYFIAGTHGSLSLPNLALWTGTDKRSWWEPINATKLIFDFDDPLVRQAAQFGRVVRGEEEPLVSGFDGLAALAVIEAVKSAAATGETVYLDKLLPN